MYKKNTFVMIFICTIICGLITGCAPSDSNTDEPEPDLVLVVLFDVSGSTKGLREQYLDEFKSKILSKIEKDMQRNDFLFVERITSHSESTARWKEAHFPGIDPNFASEYSNEQNVLIARKKNMDELLEKLPDSFFMDSSKHHYTSIMEACRMAGKVFSGYPADTQKVLVLFSDMIEQSEENDFTAARFSQDSIKQIIDKEKLTGEIANLDGVEIWISGFAASDEESSLSKSKIVLLENFWIEYFKAAGASLDKSRMSQSLITFKLPELPPKKKKRGLFSFFKKEKKKSTEQSRRQMNEQGPVATLPMMMTGNEAQQGSNISKSEAVESSVSASRIADQKAQKELIPRSQEPSTKNKPTITYKKKQSPKAKKTDISPPPPKTTYSHSSSNTTRQENNAPETPEPPSDNYYKELAEK